VSAARLKNCPGAQALIGEGVGEREAVSEGVGVGTGETEKEAVVQASQWSPAR
jgi:hypothetical protein